jgi:hypothetical protein
MTAHPEIILGFPSKFETRPDWVPGLDAGQWFPSISLKTIRFHGFDQRANWAVKVRNVSSRGCRWRVFSPPPLCRNWRAVDSAYAP